MDGVFACCSGEKESSAEGGAALCCRAVAVAILGFVAWGTDGGKKRQDCTEIR